MEKHKGEIAFESFRNCFENACGWHDRTQIASKNDEHGLEQD